MGPKTEFPAPLLSTGCGCGTRIPPRNLCSPQSPSGKALQGLDHSLCPCRTGQGVHGELCVTERPGGASAPRANIRNAATFIPKILAWDVACRPLLFHGLMCHEPSSLLGFFTPTKTELTRDFPVLSWGADLCFAAKPNFFLDFGLVVLIRSWFRRCLIREGVLRSV